MTMPNPSTGRCDGAQARTISLPLSTWSEVQHRPFRMTSGRSGCVPKNDRMLPNPQVARGPRPVEVSFSTDEHPRPCEKFSAPSA